jgi:Plasmid pRiA4b ORF-3-like protein
MPKDKDLKKLVRERMAKTGEGYSIARLRLAGAAAPRGEMPRSTNGVLEAAAAPAIYQVKITLSEIAPAIWRRLLVPADTSLARLHDIIQAAFGWLNYHLHQYIVDEQYFGDPNPEFADELPPMTDEREASLRDIVGAKAIVYEYDFGDSWRHVIEIESVAVVPEAGVKYPVCIGGARSRPPEDCGGVSGYEELIEVLADPEHEEHSRMKTWVGKKFDPERFDLAAVNRALQKVRTGARTARRRGKVRVV